MKTTITMLKASLVGLFLMVTMAANAQLISGANPENLAHRSTTDASTIFVYGGNGFKLTASPTSSEVEGTADITFTDFDWLFRNDADGGDDVSSLTFATATPGGDANRELTVTGLAPGFYTFIAQGKTVDGICSPDEEEFTVFVLAPIAVTVGLGGDESEVYCETDVAENTLTATAAYEIPAEDWNTQTNLSASNPLLGDFELRYRWYKVADGTALDIESEDQLISENTPTSTTTTHTYEFDAANDIEVGDWNYYVAVDYTVKSSGPYTNALGGLGDPTIIKVTPKPGKPTITIEEL